jgi:hypothetical protein
VTISRKSHRAYRLRHIHLVTLLNELVPHVDTPLSGRYALRAARPRLLNYQRPLRGFTVEFIKACLDELVLGV